MGYVPDALMRIVGQPRVRDFLATSVTADQLSHAYLFVGPPGSGKHEAALALAQAIVCPSGGDGTCDECIRVAHHAHPDVHHLEPEGVNDYLIGQVREMLDDVPLTPIRARTKVYILGACERLRGVCANALLKTIEEPPPGVVIILIARTVDSVLPTLVSRCQQVPFRVLEPDVAVRGVVEATGADDEDARIALAICQTPERARSFLASSARRELRRKMVLTLTELAADDVWDVLVAAREIAETVSAPFEEQRKKKRPDTALTKEEEDYLTPRALKLLEQSMRRELSARERSAMIEVIRCAESVLRDVLAICSDSAAPLVNTDVADAVRRIARDATVRSATLGLAACGRAVASLERNVTPQLALEVMLLSIKEAR